MNRLFDLISTDALAVIGWIAIIAFTVLAIAVCFLTIKISFKGKVNQTLWGLLVIAMFLSLYVALGTSHEERDREFERESSEKYEHIVECIENGYTLYVNGTEVELSHITLEEYSLSAINVYDEVKEVHIAATDNE